MGLFDKKFCDVCGDKIGLLGNRKLEDGNLCKNCAAKLSPWFDERRHSTVDQIKAQLDYREANRGAVANFKTTRVLGKTTRVMLDEDAGKFMVTKGGKITEENPDVIDIADVLGCNVDVHENRTEEMREVKDKDGSTKRVSYNPPLYRYSYDFYVEIMVNNPYFDQMRFKLNNSSISVGSARGGMQTDPKLASPEYQECYNIANEIKQVLGEAHDAVRENAAQAAAPKTAVVCPLCGATTIPDANGRCEYCGGAVAG